MYWCSKLSTERNRLIDKYLKDGQVLCDMFCGIGPLSVKSAVKRQGLRVICNDLNPEGVKFCRENIKLNKVGRRVIAYNMDAREFVKFCVQQSNEKVPELQRQFLKFDHCYMNLPVDAVEFLDVFIGLFADANTKIWCKNPDDINTIQLPLIHVNGFTFEREKEAALNYFTKRIAEALNYPKF